MQPMANIALRAARKAADFILLSFDRPDQFRIEEKTSKDFVSNIDKRAEEIIVEQIQTTYPTHNILAEESGTTQVDKSNEYTWIVDPIDGTLNFIRGIPHFAVSIGIQKGKHLEHGVIVDPINREEGADVLLRNMPNISPNAINQIMNKLLSPRTGLTPNAAIDEEGLKTVLALRSEYGGRELTNASTYLDLSFYQRALSARS